MKNKKTIIIFLVILSVWLVACKKDDVAIENNETSNIKNESQFGVNEDDRAMDYETLQREYSEFKGQFPEEIADFVPYLRGIEKYMKAGANANSSDYCVSSLLNSIDHSEDYFAKMSYLMQDLNNDGIDEFLLYYDSDEFENVILSMYTMNNGDCYCILNSHDNMIFSLCENNVIKLEFPNDGHTNFCELNEKFELVTLKTVEKNTSEEDARGIFEKYKEAKLDLKKLK